MQSLVTLLCQFCKNQNRDVIKRYLEHTRPQADGTLDAILPLWFNLQDMRKAQANLKFIRGVLEHICAIQDLADSQLVAEASRAAI